LRVPAEELSLVSLTNERSPPYELLRLLNARETHEERKPVVFAENELRGPAAFGEVVQLLTDCLLIGIHLQGALEYLPGLFHFSSSLVTIP